MPSTVLVVLLLLPPNVEIHNGLLLPVLRKTPTLFVLSFAMALHAIQSKCKPKIFRPLCCRQNYNVTPTAGTNVYSRVKKIEIWREFGHLSNNFLISMGEIHHSTSHP